MNTLLYCDCLTNDAGVIINYQCVDHLIKYVQSPEFEAISIKIKKALANRGKSKKFESFELPFSKELMMKVREHCYGEINKLDKVINQTR